MDDKEKTEIMVACLANPTLFARIFLPHWFPDPMTWLHRGLIALLLKNADFLLDFGHEEWAKGPFEWNQEELQKIIKFFVWAEDPGDPKSRTHPLFEFENGQLVMHTSRFNQVMLPRGFGKTTTINLTSLMKVCYKLSQFIVYLSETATHAQTQLNNIKRELEGNETLRAVFGDLLPDRSDGLKNAADMFETRHGVVLAAKGRGGQVRGMNVSAKRPDDIVLDDVEDKESVKTPEQRLKTRVWFNADVKPALPQHTEEGSITVVGTLLHQEALMMGLLKDPDWISVRFGAIDPDSNPIWSAYMDLKKFEKTRQSYARQGLLAEFYMEYMSQLTNSETAKFKLQYMERQGFYRMRDRSEFAGVALVIDPAISDKIDADFCAFAVVGMLESGRIHVLDVDGKPGMHPREQIDMYFDLHFKWRPTKHGVEAVAYQAALVHLLQEEMFRKAKTWGSAAYFEVTPITHGATKKTERVEGILAPRYAAGYISHQMSFPLLEQQLLDWPNAKKDFPDAVAMGVSLLDPYAQYGYTDELGGADKLAEDHYEPLDDSWRMAP